MKIITKNAAFVQKSDIIQLNLYNAEKLNPTFMKVFGNSIIIFDNCNINEFVEFNEQKEIEFFKNTDWIIDYNEIKKLSEEEIFDLARSIIKEKNTIFQKLSTMTNEEREQNTNLVTDYEFLQFKLTSLQDALWLKKGHKKGHIHIDIPIKKKQKTKDKK